MCELRSYAQFPERMITAAHRLASQAFQLYPSYTTFCKILALLVHFHVYRILYCLLLSFCAHMFQAPQFYRYVGTHMSTCET